MSFERNYKNKGWIVKENPFAVLNLNLKLSDEPKKKA